MNKIIIIGHPEFDYRRIESLLCGSGMMKASPSRREKLTAAEITHAICKGMRATDVEKALDESELKQVTPDPIWNELTLDLMLGNVEHDFWGWTDSQALLLLEHFSKTDTNFTFVFVYESPGSSLKALAKENQLSKGPDIAQEKLDHWTAYHSAMLRLFLNHRSQCILAHAETLKTSPKVFLETLGSRLGRSLEVPADFNKCESAAAIPIDNEPLPAADSPFSVNLDDSLAIDAEIFLMEAVLNNHQDSKQLYEELQASANIPHLPSDPCSPSAVQAWVSFTKQKGIVGQLLPLPSENQALKQRLDSSKVELDHLRSKHRKLEEDNNLLFLQLHQTQEELESLYLENRKLKQPSKPPAPTGAADRIKNQLKYRLGSITIKQSKSLIGWIRMPFALAAEVRKFKREKADKDANPLPPIDTYADVELAEAVRKHHLSYRLGEVMIQNSKKPWGWGWFIMPFSIFSCVHSFRKERRNHK